jgi:aminopeptidase N
MFNTMADGTKFLGDFFNYPYPFDKLDQVFIPEFRISGMENVSIITLNERFLIPENEQSKDMLC